MLKAGTYYVGDLCYVLTEEHGFDWCAILEETGYLGLYKPGTDERLDSDETTGYFEHKGVKFFSSGTAYGDGCYRDQQGRGYDVDAGLIGCFPMDALPEGAAEAIEKNGLGHVIEFQRDFSCHTCDGEGVIEIGQVRIDTDPEDDEDYCWRCGGLGCEGECQDDEDEDAA